MWALQPSDIIHNFPHCFLYLCCPLLDSNDAVNLRWTTCLFWVLFIWSCRNEREGGKKWTDKGSLSLIAHRTILFNYWHLRRRGEPCNSAVGKPLVFFVFFPFFCHSVDATLKKRYFQTNTSPSLVICKRQRESHLDSFAWNIQMKQVQPFSFVFL